MFGQHTAPVPSKIRRSLRSPSMTTRQTENKGAPDLGAAYDFPRTTGFVCMADPISRWLRCRKPAALTALVHEGMLIGAQPTVHIPHACGLAGRRAAWVYPQQARMHRVAELGKEDLCPTGIGFALLLPASRESIAAGRPNAIAIAREG